MIKPPQLDLYREKTKIVPSWLRFIFGIVIIILVVEGVFLVFMKRKREKVAQIKQESAFGLSNDGGNSFRPSIEIKGPQINGVIEKIGKDEVRVRVVSGPLELESLIIKLTPATVIVKSSNLARPLSSDSLTEGSKVIISEIYNEGVPIGNLLQPKVIFLK